jgi:hypothetical protein
MGLNNGSTTPVCIVPDDYGRRDDDDDDTVVLGSLEAPPSGASPTLAQAEGSEGAADDCFEMRDNFTADALAALAELDAHGNLGLPLLLRFGEALSNAKATLKHGEFNPWCRNVLKRSPSWCSSHRRLYEDRADLEPALAWAAETDHKWVSCRSVERLLKIIADWKKAMRGDGATAPRTRRKERAVVAPAELEEIAAGLSEILAEVEEAFEILGSDAWMTAPPDDGSAKDELMALAKRFRSRLRELAAKLQLLQLSKPAAAAPPPIEEPKAGVLQ